MQQTHLLKFDLCVFYTTFCTCAWARIVYICLTVCVWVCVGARKTENDSEWRTNPFGHIAESNTKYQNLIISIIIFIIFIHFLPAQLNAVSLPPLPLPPLLPLYINLFFPSIALSTGDTWTCQSCWLTALKWPTEKQLIFFFSPLFFLVRRCAGPYQETQFIAVSVGKRGCHSRWLTALRFAHCSVGICFKLLCFSFFPPHTVVDYTKDMYTAHTETKQRDQPHSPGVQTFLFWSDFDWQTVIPGRARGSSSLLWTSLFLGNCFTPQEGIE